MKIKGADIVCEVKDMVGFEEWLMSAPFMSNFRVAWAEANDKNVPYVGRRLVLLGGTFYGMPIVVSNKEDVHGIA